MFIEEPNETRAESLFLWCKLLLPNSEKRIYNLQSKQLIKLFSQVKIFFIFIRTPTLIYVLEFTKIQRIST